jgi:two-component system, chemotaxis family, protein-glutamate methylesterase/glutaminase
MKATMPTRERPKLRVLVVDDSSICRASIKAILELEQDIEVVGEGEDAFSALALIETLAPDLVTMDVHMPGKSGLEAVAQIMSRRPVPIVVVTAEPLSDEAGVAFRAIENGALDVVPKPSMTDSAAGAQLRALVRSLAKTPVFRRIDEPYMPTMQATVSPVTELLVVVAGPGGMPSVIGLVSRLPGTLRSSLVIHQPLARDLVESYARHLSRLARQPVKVALEPVVPCLPGDILLVLGRRAVCSAKAELVLEPGEPDASRLLTSVAEIYGMNAVGVVLAGHGHDGVEGLRALRREHAVTFAESPLSAAVSDLPSAAIEADVVSGILPLPELAEKLFVLTAMG